MSERAPFGEPFARFAELLATATAVGAPAIPEPTAFSLGTVNAEGQPSVRILLLKGVDERGFVFFTNYESRMRACSRTQGGHVLHGGRSSGRCGGSVASHGHREADGTSPADSAKSARALRGAERPWRNL